MSQQDVILVEGPASLEDIAMRLHDVTGIPGSDPQIATTDGTTLGVFPNDYVNEPGLDLEQYSFLVDILGANQTSWARRVTALAKDAGWRVLWLTDGSRVVERHDPVSA